MATTPTTVGGSSYTSSVYATELERDIQRELRPHRIFYNCLRHAPSGKSTVFTFNKQADPGATVQDITESTPTDLITANWTTLTDSGVTATTAQHGVFTLVTDLLLQVSILDIAPWLTGVLARTIAEAYDVAAQAKIDDFANSTGGATTNSISRMLSVVSALEQRDVGSTGEQLVAGVHAKQAGELRADAATTTAAFMAGGNPAIGGILAADLDGYFGDPFGIPLFQSTSISSASGSYQGWIMAAGQAVGDYNLWLEKVAMQRDESKVSTEVIVTSCYGFGLIDDNRLQGWKSTT